MSTSTTPPETTRNRAGTFALVLGIVAIVFAFIPVLSYIAWALGIAAVILGIVALTRAVAKRGGPIAGIILGALAIVLSIIMSIVYTAGFFLAGAAASLSSYSASSVPVEPSSASSAPAASSTPKAAPATGKASVTYKAIGSGTATNVTYLTADSSGSGTDQATNVKLPWSKTVKIKDPSLFQTTVFSLVVQKGAGTGKVTCEIESGGKVISKHSATGAYAVASCSGSVSQ
jgi:hypothetical protein